jgi:hypothetical protein
MARKPRQTEVPGTERPKDEELSAACADLKDLRTKRTKLKEKLDASAERLEEMMIEKGIEVYVDAELELKVTLSDLKKLSLTEFKVKETSVE